MVKKGESEAARTALYRKYRPRTLDGIVSQSQVTEILLRSLAQDKIAHAYLLTGPKGVGKTSIARILAHEINNLPYDSDSNHLDIIEIDAASNNGVEDIRDLRDRVQIAPISAKKKVYIVDEVHMLSKSAFNALLKTLEEPPEHVVFILATTDLHKVPATIISRTQHFTFHAISQVDLAKHLKEIAKSEGISITDDALMAVAARGDGSFRNAISLLDQLSGFANKKEGITLELIEATLGLAPADAIDAILVAVASGDFASVITGLDSLEHQGVQPIILAEQIITELRARLAEKPQLVSLLDNLLAVQGSSQPQLKLLTTLVLATKPKTAAAQATKPHPTVIEAPVIVIEKPLKTKKAPVVLPSSKKQVSDKPFDWKALLEYTREHVVALYSVLSKCDYDLRGDTLYLYTGRKFNKTKLDETKYRSQLQESLGAVGHDGLSVETLAEQKPPEDEKLAKIAAIMGGGREVQLEEEDS